MEKYSTYAYVLLTCIVGCAFWVALAASVDMDYTVTQFTFGDAFIKAAGTPISSILDDSFAREFLWFLVSIALAITTLFLPRPIWRAAIVVAAVLVSVPVASLLSPILSIGFPLFFMSPSSGETWGEAWPAMSAVGFWVLLSICYIALQVTVQMKGKNVSSISHEHVCDTNPFPEDFYIYHLTEVEEMPHDQ